MPSSYRVSYYTFFNVNPEEPKYLDTDGSPLKIGEEIWKSKGEQPKEYQTPYGEVIVNRHA